MWRAWSSCGALHALRYSGSFRSLRFVDFDGVRSAIDLNLHLIVDNITDTYCEFDAVDLILVFFEFHNLNVGV